jgi:predicted TIM-barrel fold metal-dependent hydrolase
VIDGMPIIDAVVHPFNLSAENHRPNTQAPWITALMSDANRGAGPEGYRLTKEAYERDWSIEEVANMSFLESYTDIAAYHVVPIRAYYDGICSVEKGLEAKERWPDRFVFYVGVDPMEGKKAIEDLEEQVERYGDPVGLKLYPNSWVGEEVTGWLMNDPEIAFPVFERAQQLGIKAVAIHKALPLGPVELLHYRVDDIDRAAMAFPQLNFEIVHGGMSFIEETAWQLSRFDNVYANLESTASFAYTRPLAFEHALAGLMKGPKATSKILWGTGAMVAHPRPHTEAFARHFKFSDEMVERGKVAQISESEKRGILAENYARMHGIDLGDRMNRIKGDEFDLRRPQDQEPLPPYSTSKVAHLVS